MMKLEPKKLSAEEKSRLNKALKTQSIITTVPKSRDNENYPVFEVPVNAKVLVYVPNNVATDENGNEEFMMDMPYIHSVQENNRYSRVRCVSGLASVLEGYPQEDTCPFCAAEAECWTLARYIIEEKCRVKGLNPDNKDDEQVKAIRKAAFDGRVVKNPTQYVTFPIVVIETTPDAKTILKDENGNMLYKIMWYTISQTGYEDKWIKALENMEDAPEHPGGQLFMLDYTYSVKDGDTANKMQSARNLSVHPRKLKNFEKYKEFFDEKASEWTPEKAREMVIDNTIADYDSLLNACNQVMVTTREKIAFYEAMQAGVDAKGMLEGPVSGNSLLQNASRSKSSGLEDDDEASPLMGMETDIDD